MNLVIMKATTGLGLNQIYSIRYEDPYCPDPLVYSFCDVLADRVGLAFHPAHRVVAVITLQDNRVHTRTGIQIHKCCVVISISGSAIVVIVA